MKSKFLFCLLITVLLITSPTQAQQPAKIPRIGFIESSGSPSAPVPRIEALRQGLRDNGYVEGKNILVEVRYAEGKLERISGFVDEFVQLKVDVLVSGNYLTIRTAKQATKTIPIVMVITEDPVATGLVDSLARPGGNVTGLTMLTRELNGKRLELLTEVVQRLSRVGVLWNADNPSAAFGFKEYEAATLSLNMPLQSLEVRGPNPELESAFQTAAKARVSGLIIVREAVLNRYAKRIAELAIKSRLPSMCEGTGYVENGCLLSYATNEADQYKRAAAYVDRILKGAKPADLPVEQPSRFELGINLKTAKEIGVTIPQRVLQRADKVLR
jgi:putative tryptophan/tyrosine transport system substrate-binding protein